MCNLHFTFVVSCVILISHWVSSFDGPTLYQVTDPVDHGEGPTWDGRTGLLYFVDIFAGRVLSYNPVTSEINAISFDGTVSPVIPLKSDPHLLIVGVNRSVVAVEWDGKGEMGATQELTTVSEQFPTSRFNDGKTDKKGRLWFGTMGFETTAGVTPDEGILYLITKDNLKNPLSSIHPVNVSNGLAWNKANDKFYYIDTPTLNVREYDYDDHSGKISNPKVVFDISKYTSIGGFPDGMTIDKDDNLWIALYYGGAVIKVDPKTGNVLQMVAIPAECVTSVCWGGTDLDILFVTTSRHALNSEQKIRQPASGSLFAIKNLGTHGLPAFEANIIDKIEKV